MMFSIKTYLISGVAISIGFLTLSYFISDYFHMKAALKIADQELSLAKHRRQETEAAMMEVENEVDQNLFIQRRSLLEMERDGYVSGPGDRNPEWMLEYQTAGQ